MGRNFSQLRQSKQLMLMKSSIGSSSSASIDTLRGHKKKIILLNLNHTREEGPGSKGALRDENVESIEEPGHPKLMRRFLTPEKDRKRTKQSVETQMSIMITKKDERKTTPVKSIEE